MENTNLDLKSIFENYDNAMPMPANFSDGDLKRWILMLKNIDANPENISNIPEKLVALSDMCKFINSTNSELELDKSLKIDIENFLTDVFTQNGKQSENESVHNFNGSLIHKVLKLGSLETFSTLSSEKASLALKVDEESSELFNEFDNAGDVEEELVDDKLLKDIAKNPNAETKSDPKTDVAKKKIVLLSKIVVKVEKQINQVLAQGSDFEAVKLSKNLTFSSGKDSKEGVIKISAEKGSKSFYLNLPTKILINKSALEIRSYLLRQVTKALTTEKAEEQEKNKTPEQKQQEKDKDIKLEKIGKEEITKNQAKLVLKIYLKKFLAENYSENFKSFDAVADLISGRIIESMDERDMKKLLSVFFDLKDLKNIDKLAFKETDAFIGNVTKSRISCISKKADYAINKGDDIQALGYEEQKIALMDVINSSNTSIKKDFNSLDFSSSNEEKENFCRKYIAYFMKSRNIQNIPVQFNSTGALGSFVDKGAEGQYININLSKIKSVSELVMTLSHELTHATDAMINKHHGQVNQNDNTGLLNNIEESIAGSGYGKGTPVYNLLTRLKKVCYKLNPNERRGRIGELSALQFMVETSNNDDTKEEIKKSIAKFIKYQNNTIDSYKSAISNDSNNEFSLASLENDFNAIKDSISPKAKDMILKRINYIKEMVEKFSDFSDELQSIEDAKEYLNKLNGNTSENLLDSDKSQKIAEQERIREEQRRINEEERRKLANQTEQKTNE